MVRTGDPYSRFVTWLKILLPLVALGLLSTLFMFSSRIEPGGSIPFAEREVTERIRGQQVTKPFFSSTTDSGDRILFSASDLTRATDAQTKARNMHIRLDFAEGTGLDISADEGRTNADTNQVELEGNILLQGLGGYSLRTSQMSADLTEIEIVAPQTVTGQGPIGELTAGDMRIFGTNQSTLSRIVFSNGVRLVYMPQPE